MGPRGVGVIGVGTQCGRRGDLQAQDKRQTGGLPTAAVMMSLRR